MELELMPCPTCREVTLVEVPPCADEHGRACPDRACTVCGAALSFAGRPMVDALLSAASGPPGSAAGRSRSAA